MKKLVFTALVVVGISGAAMANTAKGIEKVVISNENKVEVAVFQGPGENEGVATQCQDMAIDVYEHEIGSGADDLTLLNALMAMCELK